MPFPAYLLQDGKLFSTFFLSINRREFSNRFAQEVTLIVAIFFFALIT